MISIEQISGEIAALEEEKPTHVVMQKLASLYIVRDHMTLEGPTNTNLVGIVPPMDVDSEFIRMIEGKNIESVVSVMNELVETVQIVKPQLYNGVMRKVAEI